MLIIEMQLENFSFMIIHAINLSKASMINGEESSWIMLKRTLSFFLWATRVILLKDAKFHLRRHKSTPITGEWPSFRPVL